MRLGTLVKPSRWTPNPDQPSFGVVTAHSQKRSTMSVLSLERNRRATPALPLVTSRSYGIKDWVPVDEIDMPETLDKVCDYTRDEWDDLSLRYPDVISAFLSAFMNPPNHSPKGFRL